MKGLDELRGRSDGAGIRIGLIDGPVDSAHPSLRGARIEVVGSPRPSRCAVAEGYACRHGTSIAAILVGQGAAGLWGIAPRAVLVSRPLFGEHAPPDSVPRASPEALAAAIVETIAARVHVINLSISVTRSDARSRILLTAACEEAARRGVIIVAATGNDGHIGPLALLDHPWPLPVVAALPDGRVDGRSNLGPTIARRGLAAPGQARSAIPPDGVALVRGTSVATAHVAGMAALLLAAFPGATAHDVRRALLAGTHRVRTIVPPNADAYRAAAILGGQ